MINGEYKDKDTGKSTECRPFPNSVLQTWILVTSGVTICNRKKYKIEEAEEHSELLEYLPTLYEYRRGVRLSGRVKY